MPIVTCCLQRQGFAGTPMVAAADAGMLSGTNLKAPDELELSFIVGSRATKAPADLESEFHWHDAIYTNGQVIDTATLRHSNAGVIDTALRAELVWKPDTHPGM